MKARSFCWSLAVAVAAGGVAWAGPYTEEGIEADDARIVGWATSVENLTRGPVDISVPDGALTTFGEASSALGPAGATFDDPFTVVSLGDGGSITLRFETLIADGPGADFAVFENAFAGVGSKSFLELAFVEVSSNGSDFFRFASISLTPTTTQVGPFEGIDPTDIYNLAGKHVSGRGSPFDLAELSGNLQLDINAVRFVRIIDVVGSIDPAYARFDSEGSVINDPWRTNFPAGGFDLDAVAVLNTIPEPSTWALLASAVAGMAILSRRKPAG